MKVRQSVSVTSELGDSNNLASFNGESRADSHSDLKVDSISVCVAFFCCCFFRNTHFLPPFVCAELQPVIKRPPAHTRKRACVSTQHPHTYACALALITVASQPTVLELAEGH